MTNADVCPECSASLAQCNRSGCDGRRPVAWRGYVHPALAAPDGLTVAYLADDDLHARAERHMDGD